MSIMIIFTHTELKIGTYHCPDAARSYPSKPWGCWNIQYVPRSLGTTGNMKYGAY